MQSPKFTSATASEEPYGSGFSANAAENYERYFVPTIGRPHAEDLVAIADLRAGELVLDAGCGTGIVARLALEKVGPNGKVVGLDITPGMLAVAGKVCPPSIEWIEASMEAIPRPDESFDAVLSQYALQFVPDKRAALKEVHRVLVPSGGLVITVPGKTPEVMEIAHDTIGRHIGEDAAAFLRAVFSLHDPGENRRLYEDAGFNGINVRVSSKKIVLPPPKDFLWGYIHSTPLSGVVHEASEASRAALERDTVDRWQPFVQDGGMVMQVETVTTTAMK